MLTNRCSPPSAVTSRPRRPGYFPSRSVSRSDRVSPAPSTAFAPPVNERRMVGMRTSIAIFGTPLETTELGSGPASVAGATLVVGRRRGLPEHVGLDGVRVHD